MLTNSGNYQEKIQNYKDYCDKYFSNDSNCSFTTSNAVAPSVSDTINNQYYYKPDKPITMERSLVIENDQQQCGSNDGSNDDSTNSPNGVGMTPLYNAMGLTLGNFQDSLVPNVKRTESYCPKKCQRKVDPSL